MEPRPAELFLVAAAAHLEQRGADGRAGGAHLDLFIAAGLVEEIDLEARGLAPGECAVVSADLWKAPIRRQPSPLMDPPADDAVCEPLPLPPS